MANRDKTNVIYGAFARNESKKHHEHHYKFIFTFYSQTLSTTYHSRGGRACYTTAIKIAKIINKRFDFKGYSDF